MTKTVTISATRTDGTPYAHHDVIVTLVAGSAGGVVGSNVVVESSTVRLDASGAGSIVLATNDVEVTSPSESFYRFTVEGSSPTITRSIRLTTGLASTVSWTLAGIQVGDPSVPQRDVSSTYVTVPAGTLPGVEADYPPVTQSLTNVLASIDEAIAAGGGGGGVDLSDTTPSALGTAAAGTGTEASRDDHVHAMPSAADVGADPAGTAAGLVDDLSGVTDAATARSNLGLGGAAVLAVGTTTGTVAAGDDARLSDPRTPTAHNHAASEVTSGTLDIARIPTGTTSTTVTLGNDSRLSDARTPTAHKTSHATGGADALSASDVGAVPTSRTINGQALSSDLTITGTINNITRSAYLWDTTTAGSLWTAEPGSSVHGGRVDWPSGVNGDYLTYEVAIEAGTWTLEWWYLTGSAHGIFQLSLAGTNLGATIDGYTSTTVRNNRATRSGIVVASGGILTLKALITGKNASAGAYKLSPHGFDMRRTA